MVFIAGAFILCITGVIFNEKQVTDDMRLTRAHNKVIPMPEYNSIFEQVSMLNNNGGIPN